MSSSQQCKHCQNPLEPSASLLTSIKSLVRRPWQPSSSSARRPSLSRTRTSAGHNGSTAPEWDWSLLSNLTRQPVKRSQSHPSPNSSPGNNNNSRTIDQQYSTHRRRGRRGQNTETTVNSMADYLTLAQLENVWQQQDTRRADHESSRVQRALLRAGGAADVQAALPSPPPLSSRDIYPALRPRPFVQERLRVDTNLKSSKNGHPQWGVKTGR